MSRNDQCQLFHSLFFNEKWKEALNRIDSHPDEVRNRDNEGYLPIHIVCLTRNSTVPVTVIEKLIEAYPESVKETTEKASRIPLHCIVRGTFSPTIDVVTVIIQKYKEGVSMKDHMECIPLHNYLLCCEKPSIDIVKLLVEAQPDTVSISDKDGWLPLHHAGACGALEISQYLIDLYPEALTKHDLAGCTPRNYAECSKHYDLYNKLREEEIKHFGTNRSKVTHSWDLPPEKDNLFSMGANLKQDQVSDEKQDSTISVPSGTTQPETDATSIIPV